MNQPGNLEPLLTLDTWNRYLMLGFVPAHNPWNAMYNLELRLS